MIPMGPYTTKDAIICKIGIGGLLATELLLFSRYDTALP